jgi:hypothetical protein
MIITIQLIRSKNFEAPPALEKKEAAKSRGYSRRRYDHLLHEAEENQQT